MSLGLHLRINLHKNLTFFYSQFLIIKAASRQWAAKFQPEPGSGPPDPWPRQREGLSELLLIYSKYCTNKYIGGYRVYFNTFYGHESPSRDQNNDYWADNNIKTCKCPTRQVEFVSKLLQCFIHILRQHRCHDSKIWDSNCHKTYTENLYIWS